MHRLRESIYQAMMRHIVSQLVGFFTLGLGLSAVGLFDLLTPLPMVPDFQDSAVVEINPCSLNSNSDAFLNKNVSVQATLSRYDTHILVYPNIYAGAGDGIPVKDCGVTDASRGYFSSSFDPGIWTELAFESYFGPNADVVEQFFTNRAKWEIDVEIRGALIKQNPSPFGATYGLEPNYIKVVGPWKRFSPKGAA